MLHAVLLWITVTIQKKTAHYSNSVLVVRYELYIYMYQTAISILKYSEYYNLHDVYMYKFHICFKKTMYFMF